MRLPLLRLAFAALALPALASHALAWEVTAVRSQQLPRTVQGASALVPLADGALLAVTDKAQLFRLDLDEADGALGVEVSPAGTLKGSDGKPLTGRSSDSEGAVLLPDGRLAVSFERRHRVLSWARNADGLPTGAAKPFPAPSALAELPYNRGVEGMTLLPDGRLLLLAEAAGGPSGDWPLWTSRRGVAPAASGSGAKAWQAGRYRTTPGYLVADVAAMPDGALLVLERSEAVAWGQLPQLVETRLPEDPADAATVDKVLITALFNLPVANWEGLAVVPSADGTRATVYSVSDNNYDPGLPNLLARLDLRRTP